MPHVTAETIIRFKERLSSILGFDKDLMLIKGNDVCLLQSVAKSKSNLMFHIYDFSHGFACATKGTDDALVDYFYRCIERLLAPSDETRDLEQRSFATNDFWINLLYDVDTVVVNEKGTYKILDLTDKRNGKSFRVYFRLSKATGGWVSNPPSIRQFIELSHSVDPIRKLSVRHLKMWDKPSIDPLTGVVTLYDSYSYTGGAFQSCTIVKQTDMYIEVDFFSLLYNPKRYAGEKFIFDATSGRVVCTTEDIPAPEWLDLALSKEYLYKHPHNEFMHYILPDEANPKFEGEYIFIAANEDVYVKFNNTWLLVDGRWLRLHQASIPEVQRDLLALKLIGINI